MKNLKNDIEEYNRLAKENNLPLYNPDGKDNLKHVSHWEGVDVDKWIREQREDEVYKQVKTKALGR